MLELAQKIAPGLWSETVLNDITGNGRQRMSNNCGVFVLMYALYVALGEKFDFTELNMKKIRKWWCAVLLENFSLEHGPKRKRAVAAEEEYTALLHGRKKTKNAELGYETDRTPVGHSGLNKDKLLTDDDPPSCFIFKKEMLPTCPCRWFAPGSGM